MNQNIREKEFINVTELAEIMGISRAYAYSYVKTPDCPFTCLQMGKRIIIPTNDFFRWYDSLSQKESLLQEKEGEQVENGIN